MAILIDLLIVVIILGLIYWLITLLPIPEQFKQIALVVLVIFAVLYLLGALTGWSPGLYRPQLK